MLSSSSCLFTLILAAVFPSEEGDRITLSKFSAVCFSMAGVALVCYSDLAVEGGDIPAGALWDGTPNEIVCNDPGLIYRLTLSATKMSLKEMYCFIDIKLKVAF